jgi:hypothetical protein
MVGGVEERVEDFCSFVSLDMVAADLALENF